MTDAKLNRRGFRERFVESRGTRLRYYVGGDGPPVVLVHGFGGAASKRRLRAPVRVSRTAGTS